MLCKKNCSKCFCILPSKTSRVESFLSTLAGLPGTLPRSSLEQLFCRVPVSTCFCKKGTPKHTLFQKFSRILKSCKVKLEAVIWRLAICYKETPWRSLSWAFSKISTHLYKTCNSSWKEISRNFWKRYFLKHNNLHDRVLDRVVKFRNFFCYFIDPPQVLPKSFQSLRISQRKPLWWIPFPV